MFPHQVERSNDYTKILPQVETDNESYQVNQRNNENSPFSQYEGQKLSLIPSPEVRINLMQQFCILILNKRVSSKKSVTYVS